MEKIVIDRAVVEINGGCNYECEMCPQGTDVGRGKSWLKKMSVADFKNIVEQCRDLGATVINLDGSGEATLNRNLPEYVEIVSSLGLRSVIFSNGYRFAGSLMRETIDAGLYFFRFSVIGFDELSYRTWMKKDAFNVVKENALAAVDYAAGKSTTIGSYHLILENSNLDFEISKYRENFITPVGCDAEIWKMHNWSGVYSPKYGREGNVETCGRPFAPDVVVRAGGLDGRELAVAPCCQVLGRDSEAVLGHLDKGDTLKQVFFGEAYESLRDAHRSGNYPSYCRSCDFLINDRETLVWTNHDRSVNHMFGSSFSLDEFKFG